MPTVTAADRVNLDSSAREQLEELSDAPIVWHERESVDEAEVVARIGEAEVALTSYNTPMTAAVMLACPQLRYIGVVGTNLSNTHLKVAASQGIVVRNVTDYADEATAEFFITQLVMLARGWGQFRWNPEGPTELTGKTLGLVGMGAVAEQMVKRALGMDMRVVYYSRTRKPEVEGLGVRYFELDQLVRESDVVSLHVPKNVEVLTGQHLSLMSAGSVLINSCLGMTVDPGAVRDWLEQGDRFAILDSSPDPVYHEVLLGVPGAILLPEVAGITLDAKVRLGKKVVEQVKAWLATLPSCL